MLATLHTGIAQSPEAMVVAISRNSAPLLGGIGPGRYSHHGRTYLEILAYVTVDGQWKSHPCSQSYSKACSRFAGEYLSQPHTYTVVSSDGRGATITSKPTTLSECGDYLSVGSYAGGEIQSTAIASDAPQLFSPEAPVTRLSSSQFAEIRRSLLTVIPIHLVTIPKAKVFNVQLEGQSFYIIQRNYRDYFGDAVNPSEPGGPPGFFFAIIRSEARNLRLAHWNKFYEDSEETLLGTIHLASGRDFLITAISDPESQTFHIYGIRNGKLELVYSGGGSSC